MPGLLERYGRDPNRVSFPAMWSLDAKRPFTCESEQVFERLRCPPGVPMAWARKAIQVDPSRPLVLAMKVRCHSEERGPHLILGVRARGRGGFLVRQGGMGHVPWNDLGPFGVDRPGRRMAGFNTNDWHVYTLRIEPGWTACRVFYDAEEVLSFTEPWGDAADDAILLGSEHPGQEILVDWFWLGQTLPPLAGHFLPALFAVDWDFQGAAIEVGTVERHPANPILGPGPAGAPDAAYAYDAWVLREAEGYRMWYVGRRTLSLDEPCAIFHAVSTDGVTWRKTPTEPVFEAGGPEEWDGGGVQSPVVLRNAEGYTMWYGGYLAGYRQAQTGVAWSADGLQWQRIPVKAFPFRGRLDNNICYPLQNTIYDDQYVMPQCVVVDEDALPERRHVLFVHAQGRNCIVEVAYSVDGRVFRKDDNNTRYYAVDERWPEIGNLHQQTSVLHRDGCWWAFFGHIHRQASSVGLRTFFTAWRDETSGGANPSFGAWRATLQLQPIPGTWEGGFVFPTCLVEEGDEWKLYYTGSADRASDQIGLATVGRERLWHLARLPDVEVGRAISRPIGCPPGGWGQYVLEVNASGLDPSSSLRIGLVDPEAGGPLRCYSWADSVPVTIDSYRAVVGWRAVGAQLPDGPAALSVAVALEGGAKLHAVRFRQLRLTGAE